MPLGQFTPGQALVEAITVFDSTSVHNRGLKAGTGFGTPTVAAGAGSNSGTVSSTRGTDFAGGFSILVGGSPAAGTLATVTFASQLAVAPTAVAVNVADSSGSGATAGLAAGAGALAATGFSIVTAAGTNGHTYAVNYIVIQ